mmetsp:Transcript_2675/g.7945  ORF Transcript_2675/g.7945 Transcript_2675/m.7945 type:complete len:317 (-) Transcript_2675:355-1305(-)|eukprot:CAMPEP_0206138162 /NCGR_PEP_ID=MMETSP1473-20131121/3124_1 /ASSEMBLY_ACC=CAM_ASM_001109 /TAXON_ID=1461547 /ORGANISM="Stichococcus sp, Strain RCC1054" /LENGTH=316 /DNA_ID=CAMNT_0053531519 /DNA_START=111 /DNA_END=1061 /DNA_ORIENTATION=-
MAGGAAEEPSQPLDERVQVLQEEGFLCHVTVNCRLDVPPRTAFEVISDPDNARVFRSIEECTYRKVLHENRGRKRVAVEHRSGWRFLWHKGHFDTKLLVEQDDDAMVMAFRLAERGFMRNFEGFWRMEPMPGDPQATLAVLHQNVLPIVSAPGLNWVLSKICKAQVEAMLHDVRTEVDRIKTGAPIPEDQRKKMEGKRSWKEQTVRGFSLDLDGFSSDEDDTAQPPAASLKHQSGPQASTSATDINGATAAGKEQAAAADPGAVASSPALSPAVAKSNEWPLLDAAKHNMISAEQPDGENGPATAAGSLSDGAQGH